MTASPATRLRVHVSGAVQGVGFRPYVHGLAARYALTGFVANDAGGVVIEVEGEHAAEFVAALPQEKPALARIETVEVQPVSPLDSPAFVIAPSQPGMVTTRIVPDVATCEACLAELFDPSSRYFRYPFITCTQCGPRFTVAERLPYDRCNTSMRAFPLCRGCAAEYDDPASRRFHAETIACHECGPTLSHDIGELADAILAGRIVAVRGIGGFQLLCNARDESAVGRLRQRKQRDRKPFAVMVESVDAAASIARLSALEAGLLDTPQRPIVLLESLNALAASVAPGLNRLGLMLPAAPLHHLLLSELRARAALDAPAVVATSANRSGEPILTTNQAALSALPGIADLIVTHDREIWTHADDSVMAVIAGAPRFLRRARGHVPDPVRLASRMPPVLAVGAALKSTVTLLRDHDAFVSQHIGDLDNAASVRVLEQTTRRLIDWTGVTPVAIAHDLHPDIASTRLATRLAEEYSVPVIPVQHHHAHAAAVVAEHGLRGPVLALVLDGHGHGLDGGNWGGELLLCDGAQFARLGHLAPLKLPGGDRAAREPWRMAAAALHAIGQGSEIAVRFPKMASAAVMAGLIAQQGCPVTTSAGRLFDAAAGLLGISTVQAYEGEAAMRLEAFVREPVAVAGGWCIEGGDLSFLPLLKRLAATAVQQAEGAALFHGTFAAGCVDWLGRAADVHGVRQVVLGGGCFQNAVITGRIIAGCLSRGLRPHLPWLVPANDGGLSLGQSWVAGQIVLGTEGQ